jgi:rod shape-determining protein MreD
MANKNSSKGNLIIILSFVLAMLVNLMPFPEILAAFKPDFVAIVLVYWVMALPNRIGVFSAWTLGLFVDVMDGTLFGINALSLALVAFLVQLIFHRLRLFPRWKQAINVMVVVGIHQMVVLVLTSLLQPININYTYWFSLIGTLVLWPWIFIILRDVRRNFC